LSEKATFQDSGRRFLASKSHISDKEITKFGAQKATFSYHPLGELPGAFVRQELAETGFREEYAGSHSKYQELKV
jgi:hypothetical protein